MPANDVGGVIAVIWLSTNRKPAASLAHINDHAYGNYRTECHTLSTSHPFSDTASRTDLLDFPYTPADLAGRGWQP